jgi:serine/threonine-protein kinase
MSDAVTPASRYEVLAKIASGGMASVYVGALRGGGGLRHLVALKQPHQHLVDDPGFRDALLAEARVASGIRHANVVSVREIEELGGSIQLVMDYVEGASLGQLLVHAARSGRPMPPGVALRIVLDASAGLDALHELTDDAGKKLGFVHRDVSPQNILVGLDGVARITDFGLAKCAAGSEQPTTKGTLKGKLGYMAPEYVRSKPIDARADVFAMGVVAWEALTGKRLFRGESDADTIERVLGAEVAAPSSVAASIGAGVDEAVLRALARSVDARFPTVRAFSDALAAAAGSSVAPPAEVSAFVRDLVGDELSARRKTVSDKLGAVEAPTATATATSIRPAPKRTMTAAIAVVGAGVLLGAALLLRAAPTPAPPAAPASALPATSLPPPATTVPPPPVASDSTAPTSAPSASAAPAASHAPRRRHPAPPPSPPQPTATTPKAPPPNPYAP